MEEKKQEMQPEAAKPVVIAVDDSKTLLKIYQQTFQNLKELRIYQLVPCANAMEALLWLEQNPTVKPSAIILDWMMEGMSGLELLDRLKGDARWKDIPVIMATANRDQADVVKACAKGAQDYIVKPIQNKVLVKKLEKAVAGPGVAAGAVAT